MPHCFPRLLLATALLFGAEIGRAQTTAAPRLALTPVISGLSRCVGMAQAPGDNRLFVIDRAGRIRIVTQAGALLPTPFLDISSRVTSTGSEQGLLGLAFHPDYRRNGFFFVNYIDSGGNTRIARFQRQAGSTDLADPASELLIFAATQPFANHNGGDLKFGPRDGYLYASLGDGGSANDPGNRAQNLGSPLGKILRFDIDGGSPYAVPPTNPLVNTPGALPEIWLWGLRNTWRFSFDSANGDLWLADVGQNAWEEVNVFVDSANANRNFGWRCYEGNHVAVGGGCQPITSYHAPIFEYPHSNATGGFSITGGFVYRGTDSPALAGRYVFTDYVSGNFWTTSRQGATYSTQLDPQFNRGGIASFGQDSTGEMYCVQFTTISRLSATAPSGLLPNAARRTLRLAPNPAAATCRIELPVAEAAELQLVSLLTGQIVRTFTADARTATATLDVRGLAAGAYAIRTQLQGQPYTQRLMVQPD
jgi:glucose/arabinose dehydrogenase